MAASGQRGGSSLISYRGQGGAIFFSQSASDGLHVFCKPGGTGFPKPLSLAEQEFSKKGNFFHMLCFLGGKGAGQPFKLKLQKQNKALGGWGHSLAKKICFNFEETETGDVVCYIAENTPT